MLIIGIDPDLVASGVAVTTERRAIAELSKVKLSGLVDFMHLQAAKVEGRILIKMEDPNMLKPTFPRALSNKLTQAQRIATMRKISQDVGKVKAAATLIMELLKDAGFNVQPCRPLSGGHKARCKNDAAYFNALTGWTARSNEDCRDAALIALFGV